MLNDFFSSRPMIDVPVDVVAGIAESDDGDFTALEPVVAVTEMATERESKRQRKNMADCYELDAAEDNAATADILCAHCSRRCQSNAGKAVHEKACKVKLAHEAAAAAEAESDKAHLVAQAMPVPQDQETHNTPAQKLADLEARLRKQTSSTAEQRVSDLEQVLGIPHEPMKSLAARIAGIAAAAEQQGW